MEKVKEFDYLEIYWDEESNCLISQWHGGHEKRNIKEGLDTALAEFIERRKTKEIQWIGDVRDIGIIKNDEQDWINTDWFPRFLATGVKYMGVVQPESAIAKMTVDSVVSTVEGTDLTIYNSSTLEEAQKWMTENVK